MNYYNLISKVKLIYDCSRNIYKGNKSIVTSPLGKSYTLLAMKVTKLNYICITFAVCM